MLQTQPLTPRAHASPDAARAAHPLTPCVLRIPGIRAKLGGRSRSQLYRDAASGLLTPFVKLGPRSVGLPEHEVDALLRARIAGQGDAAIRVLVKELVAARSEVPA